MSLGVNGGVIIAHGSSDARAIKNAINQGIKFAKGNVVEEIKEFIKTTQEQEIEE